MNQALFDKRSVVQVIGGIMKRPDFIDEYNVAESDFEVELFYRIIYCAINNLYRQGVKVIDSFAIDSLISNYPEQYRTFKENEGVMYCSQANALCELDNFKYYLQRVKKFSLLRYLEQKGYDVKHLYDWSVTDSRKQEEEISKLDGYTINEMIEKVETDLIINSQVRFLMDKSSGQLVGRGMRILKESLKEAPEFGLPLQSPILTTVARGCRLKKVYVRSSASGFGKSRTALADFSNLSIPWCYDTKHNKWIHTGISEPALFISTELEIDEVQTIVLSYVSGVPEDRILDGVYKPGEEERVDKAIEFIEASPLHIEYMPDFSVNDIETLIKKYVRDEGVKYVCFDYIHMSNKLISEISRDTNGMKLREDQILFLFIDRLKNLCNTMKIFLLTMTQLNGTYKDSPIKDETMLRGAKSLADRIDMGEIVLPPTEADLKAVKGIVAKQVGMPTPNMVRHIYKLRRGKLSKIRIWEYVDLGVSRTIDLFATNYDYKLIPIDATRVILDNVAVDEKIENLITQESVDASTVTPLENDEKAEGDEADTEDFRLAINW
jgi:replicative DNA helicase